MNLAFTIKEIKKIGLFGNSIFSIGINHQIDFYESNSFKESKFKGEFIYFLGNRILFQNENGGDFQIFDSELKLIKEYQNFYHWTFRVWQNTFLIYFKENGEVKNLLIDENLNEFKLPSNDFMYLLSHYVFNCETVNLKAYNYKNEKGWQSDISHYGQKRYNHRNEEIDSSTPNTISGEVIGYEDTIVVPLSGKQFVALNIADGSFKWIIEYEKRQNYFAWHENRLYTYWRNFIHEIDICTGEIVRNLEVSSIYIDKYNDWPNRSLVSGGKLIIDFLKTDNSLLIIDLIDFTIHTAIIVKSEGFLKANQGDIVWHNDKLYARDSLTNTLYVFE